MNEQNPPPNIQMTPVEFSPAQSGDAIGTVMPASRPEFQISAFWPVFIVLLTLIFSTGRDMVTLNKRMAAVNDDIAPAQEVLKQAKKQADYVDSLHVSLQKLAATDPIAAQILAEYFTSQADQKKAPLDNSAAPPAK